MQTETTSPWYVIEAKAFRAQLVADELDKAGMTYWRPIEECEIRIGRGNRRAVVEVTRPLFDPYVFVQTELSDHARAAILATRGVNRFICPLGENPVPLPAGWVERFMWFLESRRIERIRAKLALSRGALKPGELVKVVNGILAEKFGDEPLKIISVDNRKRQRILVQLIGASVPFRLKAEDVDRISQAA